MTPERTLTRPPACPECNGTGWRQVTRGGVEAVERCSCRAENRRQSLPFRTQLPERFRDATFSNFSLPPDNPIVNECLTAAMNTARRFVRGYPFEVQTQGLMFQGPSGIGKTHLAVAVLNELVARGFECVFFDYQQLLDRIRQGWGPDAGPASKSAYSRALEAEVLLIDDLGSRHRNEWVEDMITAIVNHRYNKKKALLVTTNLPDERFGDTTRTKDATTGGWILRDSLVDRIGSRARSRLFEMCTWIRMEGPDYRMTSSHR